MEERSIQGFCRFTAICDCLFVLAFTVAASIAAGIWLAMEFYILLPLGMKGAAILISGLLAIAFCIGFIAGVLYGIILLWEKNEDLRMRYHIYYVVSIVIMVAVLIFAVIIQMVKIGEIWLNLFCFILIEALFIMNAACFRMQRQGAAERDEKDRKEVEKKTPERSTIGIRVLGGEYLGAVFYMKPGEDLVFGTQPEYCQVLFCDRHISRVHCAICYKEEKKKYKITDYSKNGTFLVNGERLPVNESIYCPAGTVFTMNHQKQVFQLI